MKTIYPAIFPVLTGFAIMLLLVVSGCAATYGRDSRKNPPPAAGFTDGEYEGSAAGHNGIIHVRVRVEGGSIAEIDISDSREDPFTGGAAMEELLEMALIYNTADLDAISGATESSEGFLTAVRNALKQAAAR